jgi:signal transduction histidine kinase/ActR/RegA family two-component response regulator
MPPSFHFLYKQPLSLLLGFTALGMVVVASLFLSWQQANDIEKWRQGAHIGRQLSRLGSAIRDAETGERGYILTGQRSYLEPYEEAVSHIDGNFEDLAQALAEHQGEIPLLSSLRAVTEQKFAELKAAIAFKQAGDDQAALELVKTNQGKVLMDRVRALLGQMQAAEQQSIDTQQDSTTSVANLVRLAILLSFMLFVLVAATAYRRNREQIANLREAHDGLKTANAKLLQQAEERERIADQLRHSQKMEAVGQLTGGIAHDFNNMLTIIIGSLGLLKRRIETGATKDLLQLINNGLEGAERAANLTARLLAFSRQQPLAPAPIDPNKFISGLFELLQRTLGEAIHVETVLAGGLWRTHADANQLENVLINLCINARDAMPEGGKLTLETGNAYLDDAYAAAHFEVTPGQYVQISVSDTGCGMPPEIIAKVFEPFFTTKAIGKGTGLGLAQVFGFVKQSGGHVKIYSEISQGTSVKLYLPRFRGNGDLQPIHRSSTLNAMADSLESVLLVEDEESVRQVSIAYLSELGYTVYAADGAAQALQILDATPDVDLLFTDVVMPDINGRKLAEEAVRRNPKLKVLYTTGYTRNAIVHNGMLDPGVQLLGKPYTLDQLAAKLREVLDAPDSMPTP